MTVILNGVTKKYGSEFALKNISFEFEKGKIYGLLGPNGSGKSTSLKMIAGLVYPNEGSITVSGENVTRKISKRVAYLSEAEMFYESFTVKHALSYYQSLFPDFNKDMAIEILQNMNIDKHKKIKHLSKGNRGRLKLAVTLARNTEVLLLDEPFSGLDVMVRESIVKSLLTYLNFEKQTVIIATHEINELEPILDVVAAIYYGQLIGYEDVERLREEQGLSVVKWFKNTVRKWESERNENSY